jgi:hypothetical protein
MRRKAVLLIQFYS